MSTKVLTSIDGAQATFVIPGAGLKIGRVFEYDFTVDGGATGTIALRAIDSLGTLPNKFIVQSVQFDVITALLPATTLATAALTTGQSAGDLVAATLVTGAPFSTTGLKATSVILTTLASQLKMTAARTPAIVVAVEALTAGKLRMLIEGWQSA